MASVMLTLDRADRDNGCLQVLRGSHHAGHVDHGILPGEQVGADLRRVEQLCQTLERVHVELELGDALFFHANVMLGLDQNRSARRRWTLLLCYNAARNNPYLEHHHPRYRPLHKVADSALKAAGARWAGDDPAHFRKSFVNPPELTRRF